MTNHQHHPQPAQSLDTPGADSQSARTEGLSAENLTIERAVLDRAWAEFSQARASVAEVMSDDELRAFGINVDVLDERP